jgi:exopolysaccharide biosynthesis polyprenyl glycosylphosphotransferase
VGVSAYGEAETLERAAFARTTMAAVTAADPHVAHLLARRRSAQRPMRRGWLLRRLLLVADTVGLALAFTTAAALSFTGGDGATGSSEILLFALSLPGWIVLAKLHGLYERDEERADHSTVDDLVGVLHLVTLGTWLFALSAYVTGAADPSFGRLSIFWGAAIALVTVSRAIARAACRRSIAYLQNTIIVGAGEIGQLVARKLMQHPEYGINVVGFVDPNPLERRSELEHVAVLGDLERLTEIVDTLDVERVVVAFSNESHEETIAVVRALRDREVQIDLVPRLFEIVGPRVDIHTVEAMPLIGLPPVKLSPSSRLMKRTIDVVGAGLLLLVTAPFFAYAAWRIHRDSEGPIFFRQERLGLNQRPFQVLKFRTMYVDTDDSVHREYIRETMTAHASVGENGLYKLERSDAVTPFGRWLRRTSLDELPQLLNVLRGDMSLVGPRPCLDYETETFSSHHFERFLVPPGITGLWQVAARANSTFGEALDMDVSYARGWTLGLDLRLLARTPFQVLRQRRATA